MELDSPEAKVTRYAELKAEERTIGAELKALREELEDDYSNGAALTNGAQQIIVTYESRETFNHKEAMARGLFTPEQAEPFFSRSRFTKLTVKKVEQVKTEEQADDLRANLIRAVASLTEAPVEQEVRA